jgi:Metalloenzyme superfamily
MKIPLILTAIFIYCNSSAQTSLKTKNVFIITTDGFRWQEVFSGADSTIISNTEYVQDTSLIKDLYWDENVVERRKKLMPFFWNVIAKKGQLYGNRTENSKVNVKNIFKISYPGYNEILTGYADPLFIPNLRINNRNKNILEFFNSQNQFNGKVVAFTSWNMFPSILNIKRSKININSGYDSALGNNDEMSDKINEVQNQIIQKGHTRYDLLTSVAAKEYITNNHPQIVFLSFGETDEFAHQNKYDKYLQQANSFDKMVADLWYMIQTDPFYKDNTTFIITTDHGRGQKTETWHGHNCFTKGSGEIWLAMIGPGIAPLGEIHDGEKIYQNQIASTVTMLMGEDFKTSHKTGKALALPVSSQNINEVEASASTR